MGFAKIGFAPEILIQIAQGRYEVVRDALPPETRIHDVVVERAPGHEPRFGDGTAPRTPLTIWLVVEHASFVSSEDGAPLPILTAPLVQRL
jgi:hypothetical protein